jgi:hypothetical protein
MTEATTTDPETDPYITKVLAEAEAGDWRETLTRVARGRVGDIEMGTHLIRDLQACYAAGIVHGPEACLQWLGNTLAGPGNLPNSDTPDPSWFSADRWKRNDGRPVPANCATVNEPGTAPATTVRPGITGAALLTSTEVDGIWWETDRHWVLRVDEPTPGSERPDLVEVIERALAGAQAGDPVAVAPWRPLLALDFDHVHVGGSVHGRTLVLERADGQHTFVHAPYWLAVTANVPGRFAEGWVAEQMGDPNGAIRFSTGGEMWALLLPVASSTRGPDGPVLAVGAAAADGADRDGGA